jgi:FkbM family methyltransferase
MSLPQGRTAGLAKRAAPVLARVAPQRIISLAEIYLEILQGRGAGTGWDLLGETAAVGSVVRGTKRPVVFDVGANRGQWATGIYEHMRDSDPIFYLFEPQTSCQEHLTRLPIPNKTIIRAAVADQPGEATISGAAPGSGSASLYERHETYFDDMTAYQEQVPVVTLDTVIRDHNVARVDLLKLDIEGAELAALRGSHDSLQAGMVSAIQFEFGSANIYSRTFFRDFWEMLTPLRYQVSRVLPGGRLLPVSAYSEELEHFRGVSNYIAVLSR